MEGSRATDEREGLGQGMLWKGVGQRMRGGTRAENAVEGSRATDERKGLGQGMLWRGVGQRMRGRD